MSEKPKDNPGHITAILCKAYRETLDSEIKALRGTFITSISISTAIISLIILITKYFSP